MLAMIGGAVAFVAAIMNGLAGHGIGFSLDFLVRPAGFDISEGQTIGLANGWIPVLTDFTSANSNLQALFTGLYNTIKVALAGIVLSTVLGTLLGVGRLSSNWVVRNVCFGVVEFVRNTPLLIQLVFWYYAVVLHFPPMAAAARLFGSLIVSQQGLYLPWPMVAPGSSEPAILALVIGAAGLLAFPFVRGFYRWALLALALAGFAFSTALGFPLVLDYPVATRFRASGGVTVSPEMAALLLAIVINSASYIAEIVRGAIEAMPKGQWEAAAALGLGRKHTLNDVILPQVFSVVLPSFANQFISLTKNTALGIAIGFPELFNIYGTIANQTGRTLEGVFLVMAIYLLLSWITSFTINVLNDRQLGKGAR